MPEATRPFVMDKKETFQFLEKLYDAEEQATDALDAAEKLCGEGSDVYNKWIEIRTALRTAIEIFNNP